MTSSLVSKRRVVGGILVLLVIGIVCIFALIVSGRHAGDLTTKATVTKSTATKDAIVAANTFKNTDNYDKASAVTAKAFDHTDRADEKYELALETAAIYETKKDYKSAIDWYLKADKLQPGMRGSVTGLARSYDGAGDIEQAMTYYKKVLALPDQTGIGTQNDRPYYQYRLDALTGAK